MEPLHRDLATMRVLHMDAFAYLDPGSGSMVLQAVAGGLAAGAVMARLYWRRLLAFLGIRKKDEDR